MTDSVFSQIRVKYHLFSPVQKAIADYITENPDKVMLCTLSELADICNTSQTTIIRFLRKISHKSYQVFKVRVAQEISKDQATTIYEDVRPEDSIQQIKAKILLSTNHSINDLGSLLDDKSIERTIALMSAARRILFIGIGSTGLISTDAFYKFAKLGLDVHASNDSHAMNILSAHMDSRDLIFAISHTGESREVLNCISLAKPNGAKIIAITSHMHSSITQMADVVLISSSSETQYRSDTMLSRIVQLVIVDILYVALTLKLLPQSVERINKSQLAVAANKT